MIAKPAFAFDALSKLGPFRPLNPVTLLGGQAQYINRSLSATWQISTVAKPYRTHVQQLWCSAGRQQPS